MKKSPFLFLLFCCCFTLLPMASSGSSSTSAKSSVISPSPTINPSTVSFTPPQAGWSPLSSGTDAIINDVHFVNVNVGWVVGEDGTILKTIDGGENWVSQTSGVTTFLRGVHFIDANTGYVVGNPDFSGEETVLVTIDGGTTWERQSPSGFSTYYDVDILGSNNGAVVGTESDDGVVLWPTGVDFFDYRSPIFNTQLRGVDFVASNTSFAVGWAVGDGGTIIKSTTGGVTWNQQTSTTTQMLHAVNCADVTTCWAVGFNTILQTLDGGTTWSAQTFPATPPVSFFRGVSFVDSNVGWVVGLDGVILNTTDGGDNWNIQPSGTSENLTSVFFLDANNGWAVGGEGTILKYSPAALPVELVSFQGYSVAEQVQLNWTTAAETNNAGFWVERSANGNVWESLGFVAGTGTTSSAQDYTFLDEQAVTGSNYYRLAQVDLDGPVDYSFVIKINQQTQEQTLQVYPNPTSGELLEIAIPIEAVNQYLQLKLYNTAGQLVTRRKMLPPTHKLNLNLSQLPPSVYTLVITTSNGHWRQHVVIK